MPSLGGTRGNPTPIPDPTYMHIHTLKNEINLANKPLKDCTRQSVGGRIYFGSRSEEMGSFMMVKTWESSEQEEQVFCNFLHLGGPGSTEIGMLLFAKLSPFFRILLILNPHSYAIYRTVQPIFKVGTSLCS